MVLFPADKSVKVYMCVCAHGLIESYDYENCDTKQTRVQSILTMVTYCPVYVQVVLGLKWVCPVKTKSLYVYTYIQTHAHTEFYNLHILYKFTDTYSLKSAALALKQRVIILSKGRCQTFVRFVCCLYTCYLFFKLTTLFYD